MFSVAILVCVGEAIVSPVARLPSFVMVGCALAYFARGCWREGLRVRGNSIAVRDAMGTSVVNFDDISDVGTATREPHLPPEVVLTLRSGRRVFIGGKWWWWHHRAKRYAKGPLEMSEAELKALAWRPRLWSRSRFGRPRLVAVSLVLLACGTCFVPFTIEAATAASRRRRRSAEDNLVPSRLGSCWLPYLRVAQRMPALCARRRQPGPGPSRQAERPGDRGQIIDMAVNGAQAEAHRDQ